ncbi:MAG: phosphatase [Marmoricola sp.]|nr:phosphatase [Marmoricola sp.]
MSRPAGPGGRTTIVHLLRHGEVENPEGVLYGRAPGFGLSARGRSMALAASQVLAGRDVALVVTSPMQRAQETAWPLADRLGVEVTVDQRLVESTNRLQGQRVDMNTSVLRQPAVWRHLWNPLRPSWGEPYRDVASRVLAAVEDARVRADGRECVLVSHQVPIWVTRRALEGRRLAHHPRHRECGLCSVTSLTFSGDRFVGADYRVGT